MALKIFFSLIPSLKESTVVGKMKIWVLILMNDLFGIDLGKVQIRREDVRLTSEEDGKRKD